MTNGYGPTENTIFTTAYRFNGLQPARVPIGYAVPGTSLYITDLHGHLLPIGATGELVAGGVGVAIGYQNNPALSATVLSLILYSRRYDVQNWRLCPVAG